jgi:hypothetical protein
MLIDATQKTAKIGTPQSFLVAISRKHHHAVTIRNLMAPTWQQAVKEAVLSVYPEVDFRLNEDPAKHNDDYATVSELSTTLYLLTGTGLSVCIVRPAVLDVNTGYALEHEVSPVSSTRIRVIAEVIELDRETVYQM